MNLIKLTGVNAFVKLDDGKTEVVMDCNAKVTAIDDFDTTLYLELEKDDSVTYIDMDRVVSFTLKKVSTQ